MRNNTQDLYEIMMQDLFLYLMRELPNIPLPKEYDLSITFNFLDSGNDRTNDLLPDIERGNKVLIGAKAPQSLIRRLGEFKTIIKLRGGEVYEVITQKEK